MLKPQPPASIVLIGYVYHCNGCGRNFQHGGVPDEPHCERGRKIAERHGRLVGTSIGFEPLPLTPTIPVLSKE